MKYFDAFAGIGGFALGIQRACNKQSTEIKQNKQGGDGHSNKVEHDVLLTSRVAPLCVGYSEIDKYASSVYERHFGGHRAYGDITRISTADIPDFDILVGGFPCQAFSIAGKRAGFQDTRGALFFELARILTDKKPGYFCFENVKGLLSHDNGRTFKTIIAALDDLGYDLQWQVLNSKHFGVPQNRERVFIIGNLRDRPRPQVFPFGKSGGEDTRIIGEDIAYAIDANYYKGTNTLEDARRSMVMLSPSIDHSSGARSVTYSESDIVPTIKATQYKNGDNQPKVTDGARIRRLTPLECERLQAFPDNWTQFGKDDEVISDTQRYKMAGNAVTVNVIQATFERLLIEKMEE